MQPAARPWRELRAAVVSAVCVICSLAAHLLAGGGVPSMTVLLGAWLALILPAFAFARRRWTFGRLLVVQGCGQLVLHPLFDASASSPAAAESTLMMVAHLTATVVLAGLLAWGDRVLWRLAAAVAALTKPLRTLTAPVVLPAGPAGRRPVTPFTRLPVQLGTTRSPAAERAPPASRIP